MEHDCKKASLILEVAAKDRYATNLTYHFHRGHLLCNNTLTKIPLSPLEVSSILPRSRDHLFSHSMSEASLLHSKLYSKTVIVSGINEISIS